MLTTDKILLQQKKGQNIEIIINVIIKCYNLQTKKSLSTQLKLIISLFHVHTQSNSKYIINI